MTAPGSRVVVSSIAIAEPDRIVVRGADLCGEVIGHQGFVGYFVRLLGIRPNPALVGLVDATLVAIAEHGLVPSIQAARMTLSAAPDALQGAVAAGLLGCGSVVLGASEDAGRFLAEIVAAADRDGSTVGGEARAAIARLKAERRALPGFGHPLHRPEDPRALRLLALACELGVNGPHMAALEAVRAAVPEILGRHLPLNVSGAIPATLLDAGYPLRALKGIPMIARTASLVAHLLEEQERPIGFALSDAAVAGFRYDGELPAREQVAGGRDA